MRAGGGLHGQYLAGLLADIHDLQVTCARFWCEARRAARTGKKGHDASDSIWYAAFLRLGGPLEETLGFFTIFDGICEVHPRVRRKDLVRLRCDLSTCRWRAANPSSRTPRRLSVGVGQQLSADRVLQRLSGPLDSRHQSPAGRPSHAITCHRWMTVGVMAACSRSPRTIARAPAGLAPTIGRPRSPSPRRPGVGARSRPSRRRTAWDGNGPGIRALCIAQRPLPAFERDDWEQGVAFAGAENPAGRGVGPGPRAADAVVDRHGSKTHGDRRTGSARPSRHTYAAHDRRAAPRLQLRRQPPRGQR